MFVKKTQVEKKNWQIVIKARADETLLTVSESQQEQKRFDDKIGDE